MSDNLRRASLNGIIFREALLMYQYYSANNLGLFPGGIPGLISTATQPGVIAAGFQIYQGQRAQELAKKEAKREHQRELQRIEQEGLSEKGRQATSIEIERLKAIAQREATEKAGLFSLSQTKVLALAGVGAITVMGLIVYFVRKSKKAG